MNRVRARQLTLALLLATTQTAFAATWHVNGNNGNDSNNCMSATTACKTIAHAVSLAAADGTLDTIKVAAATYTENVSINISVVLQGSGATKTIIDGGGVATVLTVSSTTAHVTVSGFTIRNGSAGEGGGIFNSGTFTLNKSIVSGNRANVSSGSSFGGGIYNTGFFTVNNSTISGNTAEAAGRFEFAYGGGIANNQGKLAINSSTISGNSAILGIVNATSGRAYGGGIANVQGTVTINNSTISGNNARSTIFTLSYGGGISGGSSISNTTISGNSARYGGGIDNGSAIQNSIIAANSGGNCSNSPLSSRGYNLSSDATCNLSGPGDMNNTDPMLGPLQNNGGLTQTMALLSGSPAIDAGNPAGCTDGSGHLLKADQRGMSRPDPEDTGGCDIGSYESQND